MGRAPAAGPPLRVRDSLQENREDAGGKKARLEVSAHGVPCRVLSPRSHSPPQAL